MSVSCVSLCRCCTRFFSFFFAKVSFPARWRDTVQATISSALCTLREVLQATAFTQGSGGTTPRPPLCSSARTQRESSWPVCNSRNSSRICEIRLCCGVLAKKASHSHLHTHTPDLSRSQGGSTPATRGSADGPRSIKSRDTECHYMMPRQSARSPIIIADTC